MARDDLPSRWDAFVLRHQRSLLIVDLTLTVAVAVVAVRALAAGDQVGWLFLLLTLAGCSWLVGTRLQACRVKQQRRQAPGA